MGTLLKRCALIVGFVSWNSEGHICVCVYAEFTHSFASHPHINHSSMSSVFPRARTLVSQVSVATLQAVLCRSSVITECHSWSLTLIFSHHTEHKIKVMWLLNLNCASRKAILSLLIFRKSNNKRRQSNNKEKNEKN